MTNPPTKTTLQQAYNLAVKETSSLKGVLEKSLILLEHAHLTDDDHYIGNGVEAFIEETRVYFEQDNVKHFALTSSCGEARHYVDGKYFWSDELYYYIGDFNGHYQEFEREDVSVVEQIEI